MEYCVYNDKSMLITGGSGFVAKQSIRDVLSIYKLTEYEKNTCL